MQLQTCDARAFFKFTMATKCIIFPPHHCLCLFYVLHFVSYNTAMLTRPIWDSLRILWRPNSWHDCHTLVVNLHRPTIELFSPPPCNRPQAWLTTWPRLSDLWTLPLLTIRLHTRSKFACVSLIPSMPMGRLWKKKKKSTVMSMQSVTSRHMRILQIRLISTRKEDRFLATRLQHGPKSISQSIVPLLA